MYGRGCRPALGLALCMLLLQPMRGGAVDRPEEESLGVMSALVAGDLTDARRRAEVLSERYPDFVPAQTLAADLQAIALGIDPGRLELPAAGEFGVEDWRLEAQMRWRHHLDGHADAHRGRLPEALLRLPASVPAVVLAETGSSRLYLFANDDGVPRLVADWYMGIGRAGFLKRAEGDLRTPLGVYRFTRWIDDDELPELYGAGAFPVDYPNGWDRARGRTGHGIWIHGVPRARYSRPPRSSEGCVTVSNVQIAELRRWIDVGSTPFVSVERVDWLTQADWRARQGELVAELEAWRTAWETDTARFRASYAADFTDGELDLGAWLERRRQFEPEDARPVRVSIRDLSLLRYGGEGGDYWHASFVQRFMSDALDSVVHKEQLWRRSGAGWEIVYEAITDR